MTHKIGFDDDDYGAVAKDICPVIDESQPVYNLNDKSSQIKNKLRIRKNKRLILHSVGQTVYCLLSFDNEPEVVIDREFYRFAQSGKFDDTNGYTKGFYGWDREEKVKFMNGVNGISDIYHFGHWQNPIPLMCTLQQLMDGCEWHDCYLENIGYVDLYLPAKTASFGDALYVKYLSDPKSVERYVDAYFHLARLVM